MVDLKKKVSKIESEKFPTNREQIRNGSTVFTEVKDLNIGREIYLHRRWPSGNNVVSDNYEVNTRNLLTVRRVPAGSGFT